MNFKALLWKEYRQSRQMLMAIASLLLFPYLVVVVIWLVGVLRYDQPLEGGWAHSIAVSSTISLYISVILCPFVAAQVMAGERADRSAEFVGYLPIVRETGVAAKAVFALSIGVCLLLANGLVGAWCATVDATPAGSYSREVTGVFAPSVVGAILMFGVSWLVSSLASRPSIGAASGLGAVVLLPFLLMTVEEFGVYAPRAGPAMNRIGAAEFLVVGSLCFVAGVLYYVRRVEP